MPDNESNLRWLSPRTVRWLVPVFLILGIQFWLLLGGGDYGHTPKLLALLIALTLALIPPIHKTFNHFWLAVAHARPAVRRSIALALCAASALFIYFTETYQHTRFEPMFADEFSYLLQMHMLAAGHLWMPALPLPQFFDSYYILVTPAYASMYFPGVAILYVPSLLLHLPYIVLSLIAAGGCASLLYLVFCEILDGAIGLLAVILLLSLSLFRLLSIMLLAQIPMLLLGLAMTLCALKFHKDRRPRWLILLGFLTGFAAITRPLDALAFALVLAAPLAFDLRKNPRLLPFILLPILPFLLLQLTLNRNITGHWLTTPFAAYNDLHYPGAFGFHSTPPPNHVSDIPEIQAFYTTNVKPLIQQHTVSNLPSLLADEYSLIRKVALIDPLLWIILPLSLLGIWNLRLFAIWGMLIVFPLLLLYSAFSADLQHYFVIVMPAVILLCLLPLQTLPEIFPRRASMLRALLAFPILVLAVAALPQFNRLVHDQYPATPELDHINSQLAQLSSPAVVLFHYSPGVSISEEPVYNSDVPWPDDAPIIRARDLNNDDSYLATPSDQNQPIYAYYSRINPAAVFYLYDRGDPKNPLKKLGDARQLLSATAH